jgi:hypothetical protein
MFYQAAVLTVIDRFLLVVDVLTGVHRPLPAMQQTLDPIDQSRPLYKFFPPISPSSSADVDIWCIGYRLKQNP